MNAIDNLRMLSELKDEKCGLNHGPGTQAGDYPACNYIVVPIGSVREGDKALIESELVIPVCLGCAEALVLDAWTLLYCLECNNSKWVFRNYAKNIYRHHILWLKGCPDCSNVFGGLYFSDFPLPIGNMPAQVVHVRIETEL